MTTYSFADCLENSYKVNWRIEDVLGDRAFDVSKSWLPQGLSGSNSVPWLDAAARRKLTHIEMAAYAHLFGYVEEFIAPTVTGLATDHGAEDRPAFDALTNFAAEEVKHMNLFRRVRERVDATVGFGTQLLAGERETAEFVMSKNPGAVLLLISCIEWFTQRHFRECFETAEDLDPLTERIFRHHWLEESQHAKMDHIEAVRYFEGASQEDREAAIDDLIELVAAVDGLLQTQSGYDVTNLSRYLGRSFDAREQSELFAAILAAKRYTFIGTGVTHPNFVALFSQVASAEQQAKVEDALAGLFRSRPQYAVSVA